jgi:hypothetical protein
MRKRAAFGAVLAIVLGVVGFYAVGPAGSATKATSIRGRTIRLYEHDTQQAQLDLGDKGDSPGDRFFYSGDLFDRKGGRNVGRTAGSCDTSSTGAHAESLCISTLILAGGHIMTQSLNNTADLFGGKTVPWAITGGTGIYRNIHGYATVQVPQDVPNLADANFVLYLR